MQRSFSCGTILTDETMICLPTNECDLDRDTLYDYKWEQSSAIDEDES